VTLTAEDIREGMVAVLSVYVADRSSRVKQKSGCTTPRSRAGRRRGAPAVEKWFHETAPAPRPCRARHLAARRARRPAAPPSRRCMRKTAVSHKNLLPGKLADWLVDEPPRERVFIVEGDSAAAPPRWARPPHQAILRLRGKVLNTRASPPRR